MKLMGGIEGGGTKFVCGVANERLEVLDEVVIPTRDPVSTVADIQRFFAASQKRLGHIDRYGVGSFGPLRRDERTGRFIGIGDTPKPGWSGWPLASALYSALKRPVVLDTDVNCALRAELEAGAARGLRHVIYITVGTGIGGAMCHEGAIVNGCGHPELGHMLIPKLPEDETFDGVCPFHGDRCIEGLASGPALERRLGRPAGEVGADHPIWALQARYLAMMCHNLVQMMSPQMIVFGGGVMTGAHLIDRIRHELLESLSGYSACPATLAKDSQLVSGTALQGRAGLIGSLLLALEHSYPSRPRTLLEWTE